MLESFTWLDISLLVVLVVSAGIGAWRGLVFELLALAGWGVAWVVSQVFGPELGRMMGLGVPGSAWQTLIGIAASFFLALVVWTLLASLIRAMVAATALSGLDRVLGAWFGLVRGLVLLLVLVTLMSLTPVVKSAVWKESAGAQALSVLLDSLRPLLPEAVTRHLAT